MPNNNKAITFSRAFPVYHTRAGEPTFFVEAILNELGIEYNQPAYLEWLQKANPEISEAFLRSFIRSLSIEPVGKKRTTIRAYKKPVKAGEFIKPFVWAGAHLNPRVNPYHKTPEGFWKINFSPDIEIKKTFNIEFIGGELELGECDVVIDGKFEFSINDPACIILADNDGLDLVDFQNWFTGHPEFKKEKNIKGQIICINEEIEYWWR